MIEHVLLDTGPLVAILRRKDPYREACLSVASQLHGTLVTCWPVLTEAAWLLRTYPEEVQRLLHGVTERAYRIADLPSGAAGWIAAFMARYQTADVQLADAALMYVAVHEKIDAVFTTDRRHFSTFRLPDNRTLRLLPEG